MRNSTDDPREILLRDLEIEINKRHKDGYRVILVGDMNKDTQNGARIKKFMQDSGLKNIMYEKHHSNLPNTHD